MTNNVNNIENQPELKREIEEMISGTSINWSKTEAEIWTEMLKKIEGNSQVQKNSRLIYLQFKRVAVAAVFLILLCIPSLMYFYTKTFENQSEQPIEVFLPDNSKVRVYAQSILSYKPLLWKFARNLKLEGEAYFEVQKGGKFEVISKRGKTVVLGTKFDVLTRDNVYDVTCFSGKVKVIELAHQYEVVLTGGQKAVLKSDGHFEITDNANTKPETSNKSQNQTFEEEQNNVLPTPAAQAQEANNEHERISTDEQTVLKEQAATESLETTAAATEEEEEEEYKTVEQNAIKEQIRSQDQTLEEFQNKEQSNAAAQTESGNKEQELNQNQDNPNDKSGGNMQNRNMFRASLTPEQISILENTKMSREEKKKAFMESLSSEQLMLLKEQNKERIQGDEASKNISGKSDAMKEQQKIQLQQQERESRSKVSKEQQNQQNRENRDNTRGKQ
jgi:transmembrane sensor